MKYIKLFLLVVSVALLASCSEDKLDSKSIFDTNNTEEQNEFDKWLKTNYVDTYNIRFNYRYSDKETNTTYNLAPAALDKSEALAIMMKHVWLDAYKEVMGEDFVKTYAPRVMQLLGSAAYNKSGSIVMGTAEGGLKVTLYNVNVIDIDNPLIDSESPFVDKNKGTYDLNYWFFHTMNHEFCHILTQKKNYSTDSNRFRQQVISLLIGKTLMMKMLLPLASFRAMPAVSTMMTLPRFSPNMLLIQRLHGIRFLKQV